MSTQLSMMTPVQLGLFDVPDAEGQGYHEEQARNLAPELFATYEPPALSTPGAQAERLERVVQSIGALIMQFCRDCLEFDNRQFHMTDLRDYVGQAQMVAPASPDRVLRQLRQSGRVEYRVISRRESLYEVVAVNDGVQEVA